MSGRIYSWTDDIKKKKKKQNKDEEISKDSLEEKASYKF